MAEANQQPIQNRQLHVTDWFEDHRSDGVWRAIKGIVLAAAVYLGGLALALTADHSHWFAYLGGYLALAVFSLLAVVLPVSGVALVATSIFFYSIAYRPAWPIVATAAGGLTGFLCTSLLGSTDEMRLVLVLFGPMLATVVGQLGAAWATIDRPQVLISFHASETTPRPELRFGIRQMLIATTWVAVMTTVLRLMSPNDTRMIAIVLQWFVYQAITLWVVLRLVRRVRGYE